MTSYEDLVDTEIKANPDDVDKHGFVNLWNVATASADGDADKSKAIAAQLLGFLCKKDCDYILMTKTSAKKLDKWFEEDKKILYDWNLDSETVEELATCAEIPYKPLINFLKHNKFNPKTKHSPKRADRVEWFENKWSVMG